jgi:dTDP-4-dehydrorhamnose reductase
MYKIFIGGGSGYVGSYLIKTLLKKKDFELYATRNKNKIYGYTKKNVFVYKINLVKKKKVEEILRKIKPDLIINLAAYSNPKKNKLNPNKSFKYNFVINKILVDYCKKFRKRFIFTSTHKVYGGNIKIPSEKADLKPIDLYGVNKLKCENYIRKNLKKYTILRYGPVYNEKYSSNKHFINQQVKNIKIKRRTYLSINTFRFFISIEKLCSILELVVKKNLYGTFNIGSYKNNYFNLIKSICKLNNIPTSNLLLKSMINIKPEYITPLTKKFDLSIKKSI